MPTVLNTREDEVGEYLSSKQNTQTIQDTKIKKKFENTMGLKNTNELNTTHFALVTWLLITDAVLYSYQGSSFAHLSASLYSDSFECPLTQNGSMNC